VGWLAADGDYAGDGDGAIDNGRMNGVCYTSSLSNVLRSEGDEGTLER